MERTKWVIEEVEPAQSKDPAPKMPFVEQIPVPDDMPDETKEFARVFNEMREQLLKHKLMEDKKK